MSVTDIEKIDGVGSDKENPNILNLMIADHLDWEHVDIHLDILLDKLNNYYHFIKSGQYLSNWSCITDFIIIIYFKFSPPTGVYDYINTISKRLIKDNISIKVIVD